MFQENNITKFISHILILVGIISTVYVGLNTPNQEGAAFFFLLPLSFTICIFFFKKIIPYHRNGFGLKVLYSVILVRYIIIPVLTCIMGSFSNGMYSERGYTYGIFMHIIELFVTCAVIYYYFPKTYSKCLVKYKFSNNNLYYDNISIGGLLVILFSLLLISTRGLGNLLTSMRFLVLSEGIEDEAMYGYDLWMAHTLQAFLVIIIVATFQAKENRKKNVFNIIIPLIFAFLSCALSFGNNRMTSVYYAISAIAALSVAFPHRKKVIYSTIIPTFMIVIISFTMIKQFGYNVSVGGETGLEDDDWVSVISAYVCTTQNIAKAYDMYVLNGHLFSIDNFIADVVRGITILQLPIFHQLTNYIVTSPTTIALASTSTEVVPMAGQTLFWGGYGLGWFLNIIIYIIIVRFLIITDCRSKIEKRIGHVYLFTWISVTFAMIMTYNFSIIWSSLNYTPFFTLCALYINKIIRIKRQIIKK